MILQESKIKNKKINYIQCPKQGLHFGQVCNMVCIQTSCIQDLVCCCACIQQSHKKHMTKPLKLIMNQAKQKAQLIIPTNFNIDVILDIMGNSQKQTIQAFHSYKQQIMGNLDQIQKSLIGYYNSICQQIKLKNSNPKVQVVNAFQQISQAKTRDQLKIWIKKLVAMVPNKDQQQQQYSGDISQQMLIETLKNCNKQINTMISNNVQQVNKKLKQYQKSLQQSVNSTNIWKKTPLFKFSPTFKHPDIKLLSDFHIKSLNSSGYKFAIMQPHIEKGVDNKIFNFKIKQCNSSWIAVGFCHKNIVVSKGYTFNFSSLGHGAYMISANGGTWSNNNMEFNNKVKAFKFAKGDVVTAVVSLKEGKITFKKKLQTFEIPFGTIEGDQLHPCALFYYMNDQVQFLQDYKG